ncbi:MAG: hypothetical protein JWR26_281 [Pedosphaera sp.]|nr:hypothetical protein [Pedosphaera sp.]
MNHEGIELITWLEEIGRPGKSNASRWIDAGLIKPVNILGRLFITREEEERFWTRANAGEFAQIPGGVAGRAIRARMEKEKEKAA